MQAGRILQIGTPTEVYRRPRSRAVATFIGETNLFKGRVAAVDAGGIRVESPSALWSPRPARRSRPAVGDEVWVSIRPEGLRAAAASPTSPDVLRVEASRARTTTAPFTSARSPSAASASATFHSPATAEPDRGGAPAAAVGVEVAPEDVVLLPLEAAVE